MNIEMEDIDHIHVNVANREASEKWYKSTLGLFRTESLEFWAENGGPLTLQNESGSIHIALFENPSIQNTTIAFRLGAAALHEFILHLSTLGIKVKPVDHELSWSIYFKDPDGNPYEVTTYEYDQFSSYSAQNA